MARGVAGGAVLGRPRVRPVSWSDATLVAAPLIGALFAYLSYRYNPLVLPAALVVLVTVAMTLARVEIGIAFGLVLIALGPVASPEVFDLIEWPPWVVPSAWIAFVFAVGVTRATATRGLAMPALGIPLGLLLLAGVVSFPIADSLSGGLPIVRMLITGTMLFVVTAITLREPEQFRWVMRGVAAAAIVVGSVAVYQQLIGSTSGGLYRTASGELAGRVSAGFAHANALGGFLVVLVPLMIAGIALDRRLRWLYAVGIGLAVLGIYFSASRGAMVALAASPLVFIRPRHLVALLPLLGVVLALAWPSLLSERFASQEEGSALAGRTDIWSTAGQIWEENPLVGVGLGGFGEAYAQIEVPGKDYLPETVFAPPPHAHNLFLQSLSEQGLVGFVALVVLLAAAARLMLKLRRDPDPWLGTMGTALIATLLVFLIHNQLDVTLLGETGNYFFVFLGLTSALAAVLAARGARGSRHGPLR